MVTKMVDVLTIKVDINQKGLEKLVEMGKLGEFMDRLSMEAGNQIKTQATEHLVKAGIGKTAIGGVTIVAGFDDDGPWFGGPPRPPRPHRWGELTQTQLGSVVQIVLPSTYAPQTQAAAAALKTETAGR
jgi:hypothetical protein